MKTFFVSIIVSIIFTGLALMMIIYYQVDIAGLFGATSPAESNRSIVSELLAPLAASFFGAISGALCAFALQNRREEEKARENEVTAINKALLVLESQFNELCGIKKTTVLPEADEPMRFVSIKPTIFSQHIKERVNIDFATPLINLDRPAIIQDIRVAERRFYNVLQVLNIRDEFKRNIDLATQNAGINILGTYTLDRLLEVIGPNDLALLYQLTEDYLSVLDVAIQSLDKCLKELPSIAIENYKGVKIRKLSFHTPGENSDLVTPVPKPFFESVEDLLNKAGYNNGVGNKENNGC